MSISEHTVLAATAVGETNTVVLIAASVVEVRGFSVANIDELMFNLLKNYSKRTESNGDF